MSQSSDFVKSTGMALAWIGRTMSFDQEREELMLARFALALACPQPPDPRESEQWATFIEREPMRDLWPGVCPFTE